MTASNLIQESFPPTSIPDNPARTDVTSNHNIVKVNHIPIPMDMEDD